MDAVKVRVYRCARCGKGTDATQRGKRKCSYCGGGRWGYAFKIEWHEAREIWHECGLWFYSADEKFWRKWYADFMTWYAKRHKIGWINKE